MAQRLNKNMVVGLSIAGMAVTTVGMMVLIMLVPARRPEPIAEQAAKNAAAGQYQQAMVAYIQASNRALRAKCLPEQVNGYRILAGEMAQKAGKIRDALESWNQVLRADATNTSAQEHIVRLYLDVYRQQGFLAESEWDAVQTAAQTEQLKETPLGLGAAGLSLVKRRTLKAGNANEGRILLEKACAIDKSDPDLASYLADFHLEEARMLLSASRPEENLKTVDEHITSAENVYEQLKTHLPADAKLVSTVWRYRGTFYTQLRSIWWYRVQKAISGQLGAGTEPMLRERLADADRKALESLEQAIQTAPEADRVLRATNRCALGDYWVSRIPTEKEEAARKKEQEAFFAKAKGAYREAVQLAPDEFDAYNKLAILCRLLGENADATKVLEERLARGIQSGTYLELRNRFFMAKFRQDAFDNLYAQAASESAGESRTQLLKRMERLHEEYANESQGGAESAVAKLMQARLFMLQNRLADAMKKAEEAYETIESADAATKVSIKFLLAQLYVSKELLVDADKLLKEVTDNEAVSDNVWALRALVQLRQRQAEAARQSAQKALQLNPGNRQALGVMAAYYEAQGNTKELAVIRKQLGIEVNQALQTTNEAKALLRAGRSGEERSPENLKKGEDMLRGILKTQPDFYPALEALVAVLVEQSKKHNELMEPSNKEIKGLLTAALAELDRKKAQTPATAPSDAAATDFAKLKLDVRMLEILADPNASPDDMIKRIAEELTRAESDPYKLAMGLYTLYIQNKKFPQAIEQLKAAIRSKPDKPELLQGLFEAALSARDWDLAGDSMEKLIKMGPVAAGGHFLRGQLLLARAEAVLREGNKKEGKKLAGSAREELETALREVPKNPDGKVGLALALSLLGENDAAQRELSGALELNPQHYRATLLMYNLASARHDEPLRTQFLHKLKEIAPNDPIVRREAQDQEDEANPQASIIKRESDRIRNPKDLDNLLALAALYAETNQPAKAATTYEACRELAPENLQIIGNYATFLSRKQPPDNAAAQNLLQKAIQSLTDPTLKATAQLMLAGNLEQMMRRGDDKAPTLEAVTAAFEAAAQISPRPEVMIDIGQFYARLGRAKEAEANYHKAIELSQDEEQREINRLARQTLIRVLLFQGPPRAGDAEKEIAAYNTHFAADGFGDLAASDLAVAAGKPAEALKNLKEFIQKNPQNANGWARSGFTKYQQGDISGAMEDLGKAVNLDPKAMNYEHRRVLAHCRAQLNQPELAITELRSILNEEKNASLVAGQLADLYVKLKRYADAESILLPRSRDALDRNRALWLVRLSRVYTYMGDATHALQAAREAAEVSGMPPDAVNTFADTCVRMKRYADAIDFITTKVPPDRAKASGVQLKLAECYALDNQPAKAIPIFERLLDEVASDLKSYGMVATSLSRSLKKDQAQGLFTRRLQAKPDDWNSKFGLAVLTTMSGNVQDGLKMVDALLNDLGGTDPATQTRKIALLREVSGTALVAGDKDRARKYYQQLLELDPDNVMARNNLSYVLWTDFKDAPGALEQARLAVNKLPTSMPATDRATVLDTLGWSLVQTGDFNKAIPQLWQAIQGADTAGDAFVYNKTQFYYHLAEALYRRNQAAGTAATDADLREAVMICQQGYRLLQASAASGDPDKLEASFQQLASKMKIKLGEAPTTQAATEK